MGIGRACRGWRKWMDLAKTNAFKLVTSTEKQKLKKSIWKFSQIDSRNIAFRGCEYRISGRRTFRVPASTFFRQVEAPAGSSRAGACAISGEQMVQFSADTIVAVFATYFAGEWHTEGMGLWFIYLFMNGYEIFKKAHSSKFWAKYVNTAFHLRALHLWT